MDPHTVTLGSKPVKKGRTNKTPQIGTFIEELNKINSYNKVFNTSPFSNYNGNKLFSTMNNIQILPSNGLINKLFLPYLKQIKRDELKTKTKKNSYDSSNCNEKRESGFFLYSDPNIEEEQQHCRGKLHFIVIFIVIIIFQFFL